MNNIENTTMNVVYSSSDLFSEIAATSIYSLLKNNSYNKIHIYVIDNNIGDEHKKKLYKIVERFGASISFFPLPDISRIIGRKIEVGRWNISTFGRCFLPSILPNTVDKLLFIDADTIVRSSLENLYFSNMNGKAVLGVDDCRSGNYRTNIDLDFDAPYINCGFMMVDLAMWRKLNIEKEFVDFINNKNGDITYMDQGVINGVLGKHNLVGLIPPKYNCQRLYFDFCFNDFIRIRKPAFSYDKADYESAISNPTIVHFTTCFISGTRPWNKNDKHPYKQEFLGYRKEIDWNEFSFWPDNRKLGKKAMTVICNIMPKALMISIISFIHTDLYPLVRNIKMTRRT